MKTIIVPMQCQPECNQLFRLSAGLFPEQRINFRFLHIRVIPDNYNDLLTISRNTVGCTPFTPAFIRQVNGWKALYSDRISFTTDEIYGDSPAVFRNYAQHHQCDLIIYDHQGWKDAKELNVFRMVSRSGIELVYMNKDSVETTEKTASPAYRHPLMNIASTAPVSIRHQYQAVEERIDNLQAQDMISKKLSNLSRYFLSENVLQKFLSQSGSSMMLVKTD